MKRRRELKRRPWHISSDGETLCGGHPRGWSPTPLALVEGALQRNEGVCCSSCLEKWEQEFKGALFSFTKTWLEFTKGLVIEPGARFVFGCSRSHVLGEGIPFEVTWANPHGWDAKYEEGTTKEGLAPEVFSKWCAFREMVEVADKEGRVKWRK